MKKTKRMTIRTADLEGLSSDDLNRLLSKAHTLSQKRLNETYVRLGEILPVSLMELSASILEGRSFEVPVMIPNKMLITLDLEENNPIISDWEFVENYEDKASKTLKDVCKKEKAKLKEDFKQLDKQIKQIAKEHNINPHEIYNYLGW